MRKSNVLVALLFIAVQPYFLVGQNKENLLINGSLEFDGDTCTKAGRDSLRFVPNWGVIRTPDLVCVCDSNQHGVREKVPRRVPDGRCYGVLVINRDSEPLWGYKEAIIGRLFQPLVEGRTYCLNFLYSYAKISNYFTNNMDVRFVRSNFIDNYTTSQDFYSSALDMTVEIEYDTVLWRIGKLEYVAKGGEQNLILGFLTNPQRTFVAMESAVSPVLFILIDSIAVYDCTEGVEFGLPNVFTPNGDGENEVYRSDQFNVDRVEWVVLNRWGQVVHSGKAPELEWDGRDVHSGEDLAEGVYFVRATAYGNDGSTRTEQQTVHLMR